MIAAAFLLLLPLSMMAQDPSAYDIYTQLLEESVDSSKRYSEGKVDWRLGRSGGIPCHPETHVSKQRHP